MFGKRWIGLVVFVLLLTLFIPALAATQLADHNAAGDVAAPVTVITVDSGDDPDNSKSKSCISATPCTLRRAIVQARALPAEDRPILIDFNIPTSDDAYNGALKVWELELLAMSDPAVFRRLEFGQITIDGDTQPNGRSNGPKIILIGPGTGNKDGIIVGVNNTGDHDGNVIRGLAFQNLKTHVTVNSNENLIEENWFGLTSNGMQPYLRDDEPEDGSGSAGVALSAGAADNIIRNNVFLGLDGVAATLRGEDNAFLNNYVGTNADGAVPGKQTDKDLICTKVDWLGGGGVNLDGEGHLVEDNIIAGLRQEIFSSSTQPPAIELSGKDHAIQGNKIGWDSEDDEIGVCGRGIYLTTSPKNVLVTGNDIVNPGMSGISLNGALYDANTLHTNSIKSSSAWHQVEGNPEKEDAIQLGPSLPDAMLAFNPALVTDIDGKMVSGTNWPGSPCPKCEIDLFLDDKDGVKEALVSLAVVTADENGDWTVEIPIEIDEDHGIRTTSTTAKFNTIQGMSAGTTTGLSALAVQRGPTIFLPVIIGK